MEKLIGLTVAFIGLLFAMNAQGKKLATETDENIPDGEGNTVTLDDIYKDKAEQFNLDWRLIKAIAIVESNERPNAVNPSDPSMGLMQILCIPDGKGGCKNKFNIIAWPPKSKDELFDPDYNVFIGAQILKWNIDTYGLRQGVAVYNNWSARNESEPFSNQSYVDKVFREYNALKNE